MASDEAELAVLSGLLDGEKKAQHEISALSKSTLADKAAFTARVTVIKDVMSDLRAHTRDLELLAEEASTCVLTFARSPPSSTRVAPSPSMLPCSISVQLLRPADAQTVRHCIALQKPALPCSRIPRSMHAEVARPAKLLAPPDAARCVRPAHRGVPLHRHALIGTPLGFAGCLTGSPITPVQGGG